MSTLKLAFLFAFLFNVVAAQAATVIPKIIKISVTPTSATAGTKFKFTAELDNQLPTNYKVKITLANTQIVMSGTKTSYSLSRAIYKTGSQTYTLGIYNAKNALQGKISSGDYTVSSASPENHAPTLSLVKADATAITNTAYTVTLNAKDVDANLNSITMNWGDNSEPETLTITDSNDLVFNHIYTSASSFGWNAFASDKGSPVLNSKSVSKIVTVSDPVVEVIAPPVVIPIPAKTTGYTKIANDGSELPDSATLGANPTDWACTKDNKTGLIWEVKGNDGVTRDKTWLYTWNDNVADCTGIENCTTYVYGYTARANNSAYCGGNNWRIPSIAELKGLVYCSEGKSTTLDATQYGLMCLGSPSSPPINTDYFPNTTKGIYWSSSIFPNAIDAMWYVDFNSSMVEADYKNKYAYLRLVRDSKTTPTPTYNYYDLNRSISDLKTQTWKIGQLFNKGYY